ncbi:MAG: DNA polymerase III subunit beta [Clostridia bacterium]|jgi:DNA polymerase-3 subunit beta
MKIICSKENLQNGINIVQKAVSTKTTLPILEGILLEAEDKFKMTGNDLEIGIECFVEADIKGRGAIVLNSKMLGDIVRKMPDSEVLIEAKENNTVIIECENSHFELKGISSEGFPSIPEIKKENGFEISQNIIRDMVRQTIFAVSFDENRPVLTGEMIEFKEGEMVVVSIDGYRLALRKSKVEGIDVDINVVVPGKTLGEIIKILSDTDEKINIYTSENQILFDLGNCRVVSRLLDGDYLNYKSIIPPEFETKIKVKTEEILSSIERASIITMEDKRYPIKLVINTDNMIISSNTDTGANREEIHIDTEGNNLEIGFNPRYFIDALKVIEDEVVEISFTSNVGPCVIKPVNGEKFIYLILPIRTRND